VMFVLVAFYFALRRHVLGSSVSYFHRFTTGVVQAVALSFSILAHYAYKLLFPFRLNAESDFPPPAIFWNIHTLVGIAIFVATCFALYRWRRQSVFVFGIAVIGLGLTPVLNILPANQVLAERFLYFPSVGYSLLVAFAVAALRQRWRVPVIIAFTLLLVACSARTVVRIFDWKDELTLFQKTVAVSPHNARARAALGGSLYDLGRYQEALDEFRQATELNPSFAPGWNGLARAEGKLGHIDQAHDDMLKAIDLQPNNAGYFSGLGILEFQERKYADAADRFRRALELQPHNMEARFNLALALYQQRDFEGAVREFNAIESKDTDFVNAYFFLAECETQRGHPDEAARAATRFLTLHKTDDAMASRARQITGMK
jgi:protein O-mannosyl-transferase